MSYEIAFPHLDMLHDTERNTKYREALDAAAKKNRDSGKGPLAALDIGTGSGLLGLFVLQSFGDQCAGVTAVECDPLLAACAARNFAPHGARVRLVRKHSAEMSVPRDFPSLAGLVVSEVLDTWLIGEGVLSTMRHCMQNLVTPDVIVIPGGAVLKAQLVTSDLLRRRHYLDSDNFGFAIPPAMAHCPFGSAERVATGPLFADGSIVPISAPTDIFEFDFKAPPPAGGRHQSIHFALTKDGRPDAVIVWWELRIADGITLETSPDSSPPRTHWVQGVCPLMLPLDMHKDGFVDLIAHHTDDHVWFTVPDDSVDDALPPEKKQRVEKPVAACSCGFHTVVPPERLALLNSPDRTGAIRAAMSTLSDSKVAVVLGDGPVLPLLALQRYASVVVVCRPEFSGPLQQFHEANSSSSVLTVVSLETGYTSKRSRLAKRSAKDSVPAVWRSALERLSGAYGEAGGPVDLLSELEFDSLSGQWSLLPLLFWNAHSQGIRGLLARAPTPLTIGSVLPGSAELWATFLECEPLWAIHQKPTIVEGVDVTAIDGLLEGIGGESKAFHPLNVAAHLAPHSAHKGRLLAPPTLLLSVPFTADLSHIETSTEVRAAAEGICHATVVWWVFRFHETALTTGFPASGQVPPPKHTFLQGARFLAQPQSFALGEKRSLKAAVDLSKGYFVVE
eukprot:TRINITY_DN5599_c0_g1_i1.p1 TRINITY_DN5599_c0_g1~~TRINITY_DN5599_c0_g1_i1.p1  ORF type:complete len:684 (-),score=88.96 TRINITY_DN5599_c0_g1_i1:56-2083(-)